MVLYCIISYCIILFILYYIVLYTVLYCVVLYYSLLCILSKINIDCLLTTENMASEARFKANNKAYLTCLKHIRSKLSETNILTMRKEYKLIDLLFRLEDFPIQSPTFLWLAKRGECLASTDPSKRTIRFKMGEDFYEFGQVEFSLVTGLCFGPFPQLDSVPKSDFQLFFSSPTLLKFGLLSKRLDEYASVDSSSEFTRKLGVLYIIYSMVFAKDAQNLMEFRCVRLVDDPSMFNAFPWGRMVYEDLVKEWSHSFTRIATNNTALIKNLYS